MKGKKENKQGYTRIFNQPTGGAGLRSRRITVATAPGLKTNLGTFDSFVSEDKKPWSYCECCACSKGEWCVGFFRVGRVESVFRREGVLHGARALETYGGVKCWIRYVVPEG